MQISVQIGLNWNWPTGTELGKKRKEKKRKEKKIITFIVATKVIASRPPEHQPTGTPHARNNSLCYLNIWGKYSKGKLLQRECNYWHAD